MAEGRRVQDDSVVAPSAPPLAFDERLGVIDDPADRAIGEAGQLGVPTRPADRRPRRVDVGDARASPSEGKGRRAGRRKEIQHLGFGAAGERPEQPIPEHQMLRKQPDLAGVSRAEL